MGFFDLIKDLDIQQLPESVGGVLEKCREPYEALCAKDQAQRDAFNSDLEAVFKKHGLFLNACGCCGGVHIDELDERDEDEVAAGYDFWESSQADEVLRLSQLLYAAKDYLKWKANRERRPSKFEKATKHLCAAAEDCLKALDSQCSETS